MVSAATVVPATERDWAMPKWVYFAPLVIGSLVVAWGLVASRRSLWLNPTQLSLFGPHGMQEFHILTYLLLLGSVLTVVLGTSIYLFDELFVAQHKFPPGHGGAQMRIALFICSLTVLLMFSFLLYGFLVVGSKPPAEARASFDVFVAFHDWLTLGVFVTFILVDSLSYKAAEKAELFTPDGDIDHGAYGKKVVDSIRKRAVHMKKLSYAQIILVDIAVVIGALANFGIQWVISGSPPFSVANADLYVGGVTAGFLAAHVIVSQIVFIALNVKGSTLFDLR